MSRKAFTGDDVSNLLEIVGKYKSTIECKKSDVISTKSKDQAWEKIAEEFSAVTAIPRPAKDLKKKYSNLKYGAKQKAASVKQNAYMTGGGASTALELNPVDEKLLDMLNQTEVNGLDTIYGTDFVTESSNIEKDDEVEEFGPTKLRQKKSSPLQIDGQKRKRNQSAWQELADVKKIWTEKRMKAQVEYEDAEEGRRQELFNLQKEAMRKDEERKAELHAIKMKFQQRKLEKYEYQ